MYGSGAVGLGVWGSYQPGVYMPLKALFLVFFSMKLSIFSSEKKKKSLCIAWASFRNVQNSDMRYKIAYPIPKQVLDSLSCTPIGLEAWFSDFYSVQDLLVPFLE